MLKYKSFRHKNWRNYTNEHADKFKNIIGPEKNAALHFGVYADICKKFQNTLKLRVDACTRKLTQCSPSLSSSDLWSVLLFMSILDQ